MNSTGFEDAVMKTLDDTDAGAGAGAHRIAARPGPAFPYIVGESPRMQGVYAVMNKVAQGDANVCIEGENGTGKELIAHALHASGARRDRPFVTLDCAAIPEGLMESQIFGHVRGAFTGAVATRPGVFALADTGTLFLDEIGEMPLHLQAKLLRVIQTREFTMVGGTQPRRVDVRVITATNRDLRRAMREGRFREDLYYRIAVVHIDLPPLHERAEDVPLLVAHFLREKAAVHRRPSRPSWPTGGRAMCASSRTGSSRPWCSPTATSSASNTFPGFTSSRDRPRFRSCRHGGCGCGRWRSNTFSRRSSRHAGTARRPPGCSASASAAFSTSCNVTWAKTRTSPAFSRPPSDDSGQRRRRSPPRKSECDYGWGTSMTTRTWHLSGLLVLALMFSWASPDAALARGYPVGAGPYSVAAGDLNGDGRLDLVVANSLANTVSVLLGNGDGTFQPARDFDAGLGSGPIWVIIVDVNGDGKPDIIVANQSRNAVGVLLGNGDGTFQPPMNFDTAGNLPESIAVGDVNGDGKLDVAVAHFYSNNVTILLGNGDGTFQPAYVAATFAPDMYLIPVALGDVNGDGTLDLVTASVGNVMGAVLLGNGDGTFQAPRITPFIGDPESIVIRDFNGDGKMDLGFANDDSPDAQVVVMLGNGDGTFRPVQYSSVGAMESESLAAGDFNGDGKLDLVFANAGSNDVSVLLGNGDGTFRPALTFPAGNRLEFIVVGDFNGDGKLDVAAASYNTNTVEVLFGNGDGTLANLPAAAAPTFNPPGGSYTLPQMVTISDSTPGVTIYYTTDGSTPTTSSTKYTDSILVVKTTTIKAIAVAPGWSTSPVASATYTLPLGL